MVDWLRVTLFAAINVSGHLNLLHVPECRSVVYRVLHVSVESLALYLSVGLADFAGLYPLDGVLSDLLADWTHHRGRSGVEPDRGKGSCALRGAS